MALIKWEYGTWDNIMGYHCNQCYTYFPFVEGALNHEKEIDENNGICPYAKNEDEEEE